MPVVLSKFDKTSVEFGDNWLDSIAPVFKECSLHAVLLRGQVERRTLMVRASFGHRLPKDTTNQFHPLGQGVLTSSKRWASVADSDFLDWNTLPDIDGVHRLKILDTSRVGAILFTGQGATGEPFITLLAAPTITPVNTKDPFLGVPDLRISHTVVASASWHSRRNIPNTRESLEHRFKPVMLTAGEDFTTRIHGSFKILFLPEYCDPPVGLYWPVTTS